MLNSVDSYNKQQKQKDKRIHNYWKITYPLTLCYDLESLPIFRAHKIIQLEKLLQDAIDSKYRISFFKGMKLVTRSLIILLLSVSMMLRGDIFSLAYFVFIVRLMTVHTD